MVIFVDLSNRVKNIRVNLKDRDKKWTQKYVSDKIGVARVTYTAYENGTKTPPSDIINKLADLYEVSTDYLLGRTDHPHAIKEEHQEIDKDLREFLNDVNVWYKDDPKSKKDKLKMMKKMFEVFKED